MYKNGTVVAVYSIDICYEQRKNWAGLSGLCTRPNLIESTPELATEGTQKLFTEKEVKSVHVILWISLHFNSVETGLLQLGEIGEKIG